jgi:glycosyltransferase involved in cell wall biosynthesis
MPSPDAPSPHTPYRSHLHLRIVRELPQIRLLSLYTHEESNAPWKFAVPPEINPVSFGAGESAMNQARLSGAVSEWRKGARMIAYMIEQSVRAIVMGGYNDAGRLRVIRWAHRNGVPLFLFGDSNIRGDLATGLKAAMKRRLVTKVIRQCTACFPCGSLGAAYFQKYGCSSDRIYYFPYEPDYALLSSLTATEVDAVAARFGLDRSRRRVVYSGRLIEVKRVDLLIDAFCAIAADRPEWDLLVIGAGPLMDSLKRRVPDALRARVTWTGFLDDQSAVSCLYRAGDVLVLPSDYEPWAVVINEAAAAGLAIIASDVVGAAAELVRDGENGFTFPAGNVQRLTDSLRAATAADRIDALKLGSGTVLNDWRHRGDPVVGLRTALVDCGVVPG